MGEFGHKSSWLMWRASSPHLKFFVQRDAQGLGIRNAAW
jgi:hypothetical protein